jgi:multidrug resistance protein
MVSSCNHLVSNVFNVRIQTNARTKVFTELETDKIYLNRPLGATMFAPGVKQAMQDLNSTNGVLAPLAVSIYILGWALGPLVVAPLSEVRGRWIVYSTCNILFVVFTVACALSTDVSMLITFRFFAGAMGSAPLTIGGGTISDLIPVEKRGIALSLFMLGPVLGPSVGPAAGGYLTQVLGWRWIFWILAIVVRSPPLSE